MCVVYLQSSHVRDVAGSLPFGESGVAWVAYVGQFLRKDVGYWITSAGPFRFLDPTAILPIAWSCATSSGDYVTLKVLVNHTALPKQSVMAIQHRRSPLQGIALHSRM